MSEPRAWRAPGPTTRRTATPRTGPPRPVGATPGRGGPGARPGADPPPRGPARRGRADTAMFDSPTGFDRQLSDCRTSCQVTARALSDRLLAIVRPIRVIDAVRWDE